MAAMRKRVSWATRENARRCMMPPFIVRETSGGVSEGPAAEPRSRTRFQASPHDEPENHDAVRPIACECIMQHSRRW